MFASLPLSKTQKGKKGNEESDHVFSKANKNGNRHANDLLRLSCFKEELLRFFSKEIEDQIYAPIIGSNLLCIAIDNKCRKFFCVDGKLSWGSVYELYGYHLEADTCIAFHTKHADINDPGELVVRANDTDVAIIHLANINLFSSEVWYESGLDYNNTQEYLSITKLNQTMENPEDWIGLNGKGKVQPINLVLKDTKSVKCLAHLKVYLWNGKYLKRLGGMCV